MNVEGASGRAPGLDVHVPVPRPLRRWYPGGELLQLGLARIGDHPRCLRQLESHLGHARSYWPRVAGPADSVLSERTTRTCTSPWSRCTSRRAGRGGAARLPDVRRADGGDRGRGGPVPVALSRPGAARGRPGMLAPWRRSSFGSGTRRLRVMRQIRSAAPPCTWRGYDAVRRRRTLLAFLATGERGARGVCGPRRSGRERRAIHGR